tara:strand:- start:725 stop:1672 length:948 start_codon:yes stop_codon:yes gene_type:complete
MITYNNIVNRFERFVADHLLLKTFTHGSPSGVDLEKFEVYPALHLVYTGATYESTSKEYSFEVYILDLPPDKAKKIENQQQLVSNAEQVAEDILADMMNGDNVFNFSDLYTVTSANTTPLEETTSNSLAGILLNISIEVGYAFDSCNAPLIGVTPSGSQIPSGGGRQSTIAVELERTETLTGVGITFLNVIADSYWTSYNFNLNGSASFQNNYPIGSGRHELHGLNTKTNVLFNITGTLTVTGAGFVVIETINSGLNLGLNHTETFTEAGTREVSIQSGADMATTFYLYNQVKLTHSVGGTFVWKSFTYTITDPT